MLVGGKLEGPIDAKLIYKSCSGRSFRGTGATGTVNGRHRGICGKGLAEVMLNKLYQQIRFSLGQADDQIKSLVATRRSISKRYPATLTAFLIYRSNLLLVYVSENILCHLLSSTPFLSLQD